MLNHWQGSLVSQKGGVAEEKGGCCSPPSLYRRDSLGRVKSLVVICRQASCGAFFPRRPKSLWPAKAVCKHRARSQPSNLLPTGSDL